MLIMEIYHDVSELSLFEIKSNIENRRMYFLFKRIVDLILSVLLIIMSMPLQLFIAILIKFNSEGPILYLQKRVGKDGELFTIFKFRTMYKEFSVLFDEDSKSYEFKKYRGDSRITSFGKFLRRTSLDELPQFYNVLIGNMSMVGPRPLLECMLYQHYDLNEIRSTVKPGITGLWQISNRENCQNVSDMIDYDFQYISNPSIINDMKIIFVTIWVVLIGKGAY